MIKKVKNKECIYNNGCKVAQPKKYQKLTIDKIQDKDWIVKINAEFSQNAFKSANVSRTKHLHLRCVLRFSQELLMLM